MRTALAPASAALSAAQSPAMPPPTTGDAELVPLGRAGGAAGNGHGRDSTGAPAPSPDRPGPLRTGETLL